MEDCTPAVLGNSTTGPALWHDYLVRFRKLWILSLNLTLIAISYSLALAFRFDFGLSPAADGEHYWLPLAILCSCRLPAYAYFGLNSGYWRYVSTREASAVVKAHLLSSLALTAGVALLSIPNFPVSLVLLELVLSLMLALGARLSIRIFCERLLLCVYNADVSREAVVLGAGNSGHFLVRMLLNKQQSSLRARAVFDDNRNMHGLKVHGVPVVGSLASLSDYLTKHPQVAMVLLAIPNLSKSKTTKIEKVCDSLHVPLKNLRSFENLLCQNWAERGTSDSVDRLLKRETHFSHQQEIGAALKGKRVLITGAGGSIGSELVRQVLRYEPAQLVLLDKSEYNLYAIGQELSSSQEALKTRLVYSLTDISNEARLLKTCKEHAPQLVFHAAAYKHVPLLEDNCYEAFYNNVVGTLNLLRACKQSQVERFVFISTDKAVAPKNIMGCTKRVCELMVQQVNDLSSAKSFSGCREHHLETAVVRFGNVINSAGSVIPLFQKQILSGGPITVTHEKVERYFMSIREAASLVLTAGILGSQGEIFMLDMGQPVKIMEVAEKLRALYGRRDIPITVVGLRPGEKLTEELYSSGEIRTSARFEKVFKVISRSSEEDNVYSVVRLIAKDLNVLTDDQIAGMLTSFIQGEGICLHQARAASANEPFYQMGTELR